MTISSHLETPRRSAADILDELGSVCGDVRDDEASLAEASRDWWPLAMHWTLAGEVPAAASIVCRPANADEVAGVVSVCHDHGVPVTAAGGRSGVCGSSVPVFGGVVLDLTALDGIVAVDESSLVVDVRAGTFGHNLEAELRSKHTSTLGHWPQSIELSTVGGWLACRSAGQYSTRYGKIEDIVVGLDVVLADGSQISTGGYPRQAVGPDLTQLFVGSEGTLGIITGARLRVHPLSTGEWRAAFGFGSFDEGVDACRRILRRGATPAVLRLYDAAESARSYATNGTMCVLIVLDEVDAHLLSGIRSVVEAECAGTERLGDALVERWLEHRNDVSALHALTAKGFVVDTMEVAVSWSRIMAVHDATVDALAAVPTTRAATVHLSHSYSDGACLYFTFAATPPAAEIEATYVALWDAGTRAALAHGASLSHHHGIGLNRARFVRDALGPAHDVLRALKSALDPAGVLNPGKLGLPSSFGEVPWPA